MGARDAVRTGHPDGDRPRWSMRDTAGVVLIGIVVFWTAAGTLSARAFGLGPPLDPGWLLACAAFLGAALLYLGAPRRSGDSLHCSACEHQLPPAHRTVRRCPECGADLGPRGATVQGRRRSIRWLVATGGAVLAAVIVVGGVRVIDRAAPTLRWRHAPIGLVIGSLRDPAVVVSDDAWTAVTERDLDAADRRRIVSALLDRRAAGGYVPGAGAWIERTLGAEPDPNLRDRLHFEQLAWDVDVESSAAAGDELRVTLRGRTAPWGVPDHYVAGWLTGAWFDEETVNRLSRPRHGLGGPADGPGEILVGPRLGIPTDGLAPGRHALRLEVLLAAGPRRLATHELVVVRGESAEPAAAAWTVRRVVERTVVIEDRR